ncbi:MAG: hypothetical protein JHD18_12730, partial [Rhodoferax sp.]|nr:hypothetical protein [Rhodoferax sp.]
MDDRKNLPDHETLTPLIHNSPKPDSGNLQKKVALSSAAQEKAQKWATLEEKILAVQGQQIVKEGKISKGRLD